MKWQVQLSRWLLSITTSVVKGNHSLFFLPLLVVGLMIVDTGSELHAHLVCNTQMFVIEDGNGGCCQYEVVMCRGMVGGVFVIQIGNPRPVEPNCALHVSLYQILKKIDRLAS